MTARPFVTLKLATSLDGRIATASGESRWITGPEARAEVHKIRAAHGAVLIGAATALADDPELTARTDPPPQAQPIRVVMDTRLRLSPSSRLARSRAQGRVLVIAGRDSDRAAKASLEAQGVEVALVARGLDGVDLDAALAHLAEVGVQRLMVEGGGKVAASFLAADAVDALEWFRAPLLLGADGRPAVAELGLGQLAQAPRFTRLAFREVGSDLWESLIRVRS
jgi:diaminohydroxyphosphoribosylaminopyrimidine deaminase / 5-amino-6-(5-phosphoribosylamino)uracil reductase